MAPYLCLLKRVSRLMAGSAVALLFVAPSFSQNATGTDQALTRDDLTKADLAKVEAILAAPSSFETIERFEELSAGKATGRAEPAAKAYSHPNLPMSREDRQKFQLGFSIFKKLWVSSPASTKASDGLGPLYNARSCLRCHPANGRGHGLEPGNPDTRTFLMRLSVPAVSDEEKALLSSKEVNALSEPTYGGQLQDRALPGLPAEAQIAVSYETRDVTLAGGEVIALRKPSFSLKDYGYGQPRKDMQTSPRIATAMVGLGLLDAIHPADIAANADPDDEDGDGISGKINWVKDKRSGEIVPGRFGWKATEPNVYQQSSHAAVGDLGLSVPILPSHVGDCTKVQEICNRFPHGGQENLGGLEIPQVPLDLMVFYTANLAVPERRNAQDPTVLAGKKVFYEAGCVSCHRAKYVTRRDAEAKQHQFQLIWPYSDLLLHDMGEDLADHRPIADASGSEWRTAPLWGIGLAKAVDPEATFLHDGRARTLLEAVLWHGGEAQAARDKIVSLPKEQRDALIAFLNSL
ncbi:MAG: c-type cytochrome [Cohaesibacter sp.]|nr:c-type cytochrome [Cohaesibacter sp.]